MTGGEKKVRGYLADIGRRGGLASRRETDPLPRKTDGGDPRSQARRIESGKTVASSRPEAGQTFLTQNSCIVSGLRCTSGAAAGLKLVAMNALSPKVAAAN